MGSHFMVFIKLYLIHSEKYHRVTLSYRPILYSKMADRIAKHQPPMEPKEDPAIDQEGLATDQEEDSATDQEEDPATDQIAKHPLHEHYQPPREPKEDPAVSVFLAGSIEMGKAKFWQKKVDKALRDLPIAVYNPRRDDFDKNLRQRMDNPLFKQQLDWEKKYLEKSSVIAMYLQPGTVSPISLQELGLYAESKKIIVCCPDGFGKKGNVEACCSAHNIVMIETYEEFVVEVRRIMQILCKTKPADRFIATVFAMMSQGLLMMSKVLLSFERYFLGW
jgi:Nucleoside 2-deoxyribosyltransferase like